MRSIDELRSDTPGTNEVVHFNNCGAALPPARVTKAQVEHLQLESDLGGTEAATKNQKKRTLYSSAAKLIGSQNDEIAFVDSASRAWNVFVYSLNLQQGDEILTSRIEFGTNLLTLQHVVMLSDAKLRVVASRPEDGTVDLDDLAQSLNSRTKLVAITHAAAHYGGVNPVEEIGRLVADTNALYLVDACQSLGQMPVNVQAMSCDALTATGRKWLRGPRGTGFLYVRRGIGNKIEPVVSNIATADLTLGEDNEIAGIEIRHDARRFELWERNVAAEIGLATAIEYLLDDVGVEWAHGRIKSLVGRLVQHLTRIPGAAVLPTKEVRSGVIGVTFSGGSQTVSAVKTYLQTKRIQVSSMTDYGAPLDYRYHGIDSVLRIAPHYYNTEEEVDELCKHLEVVVGSH